MATPNNASLPETQAEDLGVRNRTSPSLKEYTRVRKASSNDCEWLHALVSSDAISNGSVSPNYTVRVFYKEAGDASTIVAKDFGTGLSALINLKYCLALNHVRAVILCHRDSSQVDPEILDLLWSKFNLDVPFMRQHFDYLEFRDEPGCPVTIRDSMAEEESLDEYSWTFTGRWNPIRLPSETPASVLRLSIDRECLSVCCRGDVVIAFVRSEATFMQAQSAFDRYKQDAKQYSSGVDHFAATADKSSTKQCISNGSFGPLYDIVHFYARPLFLRCYEDYTLRHDPQPTGVFMSDRANTTSHPHLMAMHFRRLELVKLKQDLSAFLGPLPMLNHELGADAKSVILADDPDWRKLQGLVADADMLLSLYESTMRIYDRHLHENSSIYREEVAQEQLEEARESKQAAIESKATAIRLGKLSDLAFLYLPINFVCAALGMNLSIPGQGEVPVWVFLLLSVFFCLLTYLPVLHETRIWHCRIAYHLARRSVSAGFWFLAFSLTHEDGQTQEIINSGLNQALLGYDGARTKGWMFGKNDARFEKSSLGSQAFWMEKVKKIYVAVGELSPENGDTELTV